MVPSHRAGCCTAAASCQRDVVVVLDDSCVTTDISLMHTAAWCYPSVVVDHDYDDYDEEAADLSDGDHGHGLTTFDSVTMIGAVVPSDGAASL